MNDRWVLWLVGLTAIIVLTLTMAYHARAHDHDRPELNTWMKGLARKDNQPCCSGSDATVLTDQDWDSKDGHYRVRIDGQWVDVPDTAVVDVPNRDGRTLVWPYFINGMPVVRCFMPGSMT